MIVVIDKFKNLKKFTVMHTSVLGKLLLARHLKFCFFSSDFWGGNCFDILLFAISDD